MVIVIVRSFSRPLSSWNECFGLPHTRLTQRARTVRRRIAQLRATGLSLAGIADQLNTESVATAKGGSWHASTIAHVLRSVALDDELEWVGGSSSA